MKYAEDRLAQHDLPAAIAAFERAECAGASADACACGGWMAHMLPAISRPPDASAMAARFARPTSFLGHARISVAGMSSFVACTVMGMRCSFCRYAPRISELAAHLIVGAPPAMVEIASCFDGVEDVISHGVALPIPDSG